MSNGLLQREGKRKRSANIQLTGALCNLFSMTQVGLRVASISILDFEYRRVCI